MAAMRGAGVVTSLRGAFGAHTAAARARNTTPPAPLRVVRAEGTEMEGADADAYAGPPCSPASSARTPTPKATRRRRSSAAWFDAALIRSPAASARTPTPTAAGRRRPSAAWFDAALIRSKEFVCGPPRSGAASTGAAHALGRGAEEEVGMSAAGQQSLAPAQVSVQVGFTSEDHLGRLAMETLLANMHQVTNPVAPTAHARGGLCTKSNGKGPLHLPIVQAQAAPARDRKPPALVLDPY
jgi:hypothetical protein